MQKQDAWRRAAGPLVGLVGVLAVAGFAVATFRVPQDTPVDAAAVETTVATNGGAGTQTSGPEPAPEPLTVVGAGLRVASILQGSEFNFWSETGFGVDTLVLASPGLVWELTNENRNRADVIELGFRLDALSGAGDGSLLPIDPALIPSLTQVDDKLRLDVHGIVPFIDGALGLVASGTGAPEVDAWADLQTAVESGTTVIVPGPPTDLAVVFVWALGEGDPERGLERYEDLIRSGAQTARTTADFVEIVASGPAVGAWSSSGVVRGQGTVIDLEFLVPGSGAVALPGFAGILTDTTQPEAAHRWLDFRLETILQTAMTFGDVPRQFNQAPPVPPVPAIDVGRDARPITAFDPHAGDAFMVMDWRAVGASAPDITAAIESIIDPAS